MPIYEQTLNEIRKEFPDFYLRRKSTSVLMKVLDVLLRVITLGAADAFMTDFITTIGNTVFIPTHWDDMDPIDRVCILRHERVHMRQRRRMGGLLYTLMYLLWPVPAVFAWGRRQLEMEAYAETMRASVFFYGLKELDNPAYKAELFSYFTGPTYFWMWPFKGELEAWYRVTVAQIRAEHAN